MPLTPSSRPDATPVSTHPSRRDFLRLSSTSLAWGLGGPTITLAGCGGGDANPVVHTRAGTFSGQVVGPSAVYLGIPYAQAPVGALRFQSPKPYVPAGMGERAARAFGAASLQTLPPYVTWIYPQPASQSEDCLSLNIWAPLDARNAPVVVWLHGGAWRTGATSMPLMNGQALAAQGVVVVTANYRLGALASLYHPDFTDPETGCCGNWGLQDQAAALRWVHEHIAAFGGNPGNVCVAGQSAGATNTALLAQHPVWGQWMHKAVLLSAAGIAAPGAFTPEDAAAYTAWLASQLNTSVRGLREVPAAQLHAAELALNGRALPSSFRSGFAIKAAPVQDGATVRSDWTRTDWPARVPVLITNTLTEGSFFVDAIDPVSGKSLTAALPTSRDELLALVTPLAGSPARAATVVDAYTRAAQDEGRPSTPGELYVEINGDRTLRNFCVRYADRLSAQGADVRYGTHMHSLVPPGRGVPHCAELPFVFGTHGLDDYRAKVGAGPAEDQTSQHWISALTSFAKGGPVTFADGTAWPRHQRQGRSTARIAEGRSATVVIGAVPKQGQLAVWDGLLGYL